MNTYSSKKILIAEDEELYAKVLKNKLQSLGFNVYVSEDGEKALETARKVNPNLILLDIMMPVKDGFETLSEIKKDKDLKDIPVIILSNLGQEQDVQKIMKLGATDYLVKADIQFSQVITKIKLIIDGSN